MEFVIGYHEIRRFPEQETLFVVGNKHGPKNVLIETVKGNILTSGFEVKRKFQIWRANTSTIILNALKMKEEGDREVHRIYISDTVSYALGALKPISKLRENDLNDHLLRLLNEALDLDKLIS